MQEMEFQYSNNGNNISPSSSYDRKAFIIEDDDSIMWNEDIEMGHVESVLETKRILLATKNTGIGEKLFESSRDGIVEMPTAPRNFSSLEKENKRYDTVAQNVLTTTATEENNNVMIKHYNFQKQQQQQLLQFEQQKNEQKQQHQNHNYQQQNSHQQKFYHHQQQQQHLHLPSNDLDLLLRKEQRQHQRIRPNYHHHPMKEPPLFCNDNAEETKEPLDGDEEVHKKSRITTTNSMDEEEVPSSPIEGRKNSINNGHNNMPQQDNSTSSNVPFIPPVIYLANSGNKNKQGFVQVISHSKPKKKKSKNSSNNNSSSRKKEKKKNSQKLKQQQKHQQKTVERIRLIFRSVLLVSILLLITAISVVLVLAAKKKEKYRLENNINVTNLDNTKVVNDDEAATTINTEDNNDETLLQNDGWIVQDTPINYSDSYETSEKKKKTKEKNNSD